MRFFSYLICILAITAAGRAYAGAWTQDSGKGIAIVNATYYSTDDYWDNGGHKHSQPTYSKYELNPYLEYGLQDGTTLGANLSLQRAHQDAAPGGGDETHWGIGDSEFFLRQRLWKQDGFAVSAEPMVKLPSPTSPDNLPQIGSTHPDVGMGLSAGYGNALYFLDLDAQYRYRFGPAKDRVNIAGTFGYNVTPKIMIMPQAFLTYRTSTPTVARFTQSSEDDYNLIKLQLSAVYKATDSVSLQAGGFVDVSGKNTGGGGGALFSVWKSF